MEVFFGQELILQPEVDLGFIGAAPWAFIVHLLLVFHVKQISYLPKNMANTLISAGEMPLILEA